MSKFTIAILIVALLPFLCGADFTYKTNLVYKSLSEDVSSDFEDFSWTWSGYDDTRLIANFTDGKFPAAAFRLSYPQRGTVYLDMNTASTISTFYTTEVNIVTETYTQSYPRIVYTNIYPAWSNITRTYNITADFYTNRLTISTSLTVVAYSAASNKQTVLAQAQSVVYVATSYVSTVPEYGTYTNTYNPTTNTETTITNIVISQTVGSNLLDNAEMTNTRWEVWSPYNIQVAVNGSAISSNSGLTAYIAQTPSIVQGDFYSVGFTPVGVSGDISTYIMTWAGNTSIWYGVSKVSFVTNAVTSDGLYIQMNKTRASVIGVKNVFVCPYREAHSVGSTNTGYEYALASNVVVTAYPESTRTNFNYKMTSNNYQRVEGMAYRTNIPPDGVYYAEYLAYETTSTSSPTRSVAKGMVSIVHSIYANTNKSAWTNPLQGQVIGPPTHTLTSATGWPFVIRSGDAITGTIDMRGNQITNGMFRGDGSGLTNIGVGAFTENDPKWQAGTGAIWSAVNSAGGSTLIIVSNDIAALKAWSNQANGQIVALQGYTNRSALALPSATWSAAQSTTNYVPRTGGSYGGLSLTGAMFSGSAFASGGNGLFELDGDPYAVLGSYVIDPGGYVGQSTGVWASLNADLLDNQTASNFALRAQTLAGYSITDGVDRASTAIWANVHVGYAGDLVWTTLATRVQVQSAETNIEARVKLAGDTMTGPLTNVHGVTVSFLSVQTNITGLSGLTPGVGFPSLTIAPGQSGGSSAGGDLLLSGGLNFSGSTYGDVAIRSGSKLIGWTNSAAQPLDISGNDNYSAIGGHILIHGGDAGVGGVGGNLLLRGGTAGAGGTRGSVIISNAYIEGSQADGTLFSNVNAATVGGLAVGSLISLTTWQASPYTTNTFLFVTAPTGATASGSARQLSFARVGTTNWVYVYDKDAVGSGTGRWVRILGDLNW